MNRTDQLERDLSAWFADTAAPRLPDFTDDILNLTAGTDQRPRWSFPGRWVPTSVIARARQTFYPLPWRTIGLLAVLALLIAAVVAVYVGSQQPRLPAPFGLAANGVVAYAQNGDIFAVDPITGVREAIAIGPESDREPRFSLDGTRVAFLRTSGSSEALVIVDRKSRKVIASADPLFDIDTDTVSWSPNGRSVAVAAQDGASRVLYLVDATNGDLRPLAIDYVLLEAYWRPPDGRQLMFLGGTESDVALYALTVGDGTVTEIARPRLPGGFLRPSGWSPDGRQVLFLREDGTHIVDLTTGAEIIIDASFAHMSNGGTRIVALDENGSMCVASIRGGPCVRIGHSSRAYEGTHAAGAQWSPNDEWIIARLGSGDSTELVDPDGGTQDQPSWIADGAESWQRLAR
jgi:Tol biopolymer transport system component